MTKFNVSNFFVIKSNFKSSIGNIRVPVYRFFLLNQLYKKNLKSFNKFQYFTFRLFNVSNYVLKENYFFYWVGNKRLDTTLNQTDFYKSVVFNFNTKNNNATTYSNYLIGFKSA